MIFIEVNRYYLLIRRRFEKNMQEQELKKINLLQLLKLLNETQIGIKEMGI